jgi:acyl dehydratase
MIQLPYGELAIGQTARSRGRTITETDVVNFCGLTGNWLAIHADAEYSKKSLYGQRVVQGGLVFVISNALIGFDSAVVEAFYGVATLRFHPPHRNQPAPGDRAQLRVQPAGPPRAPARRMTNE